MNKITDSLTNFELKFEEIMPPKYMLRKPKSKVVMFSKLKYSQITAKR